MASFDPEGTVAPFFAGWDRVNARFVDGIRDRSAEDIALRSGRHYLPIWAIAGHVAGARNYWLCGVLGEPGAESTPWPDPLDAPGWEDDLDHPRTAGELVEALESTWRIIAGALSRWTPQMLAVTFERQGRRGPQLHTRQSVLMRLLTHDAYHAGEITLIQGMHGRPQLDLWPPPPPAT